MEGLKNNLTKRLSSYRTGEYCQKHSLLIKGTRIKRREIIPYNEELGVYKGIEVEFMERNEQRFCPECLRIEKLNPKLKEIEQQSLQTRNDVARKNYIDKTSAVLTKKSIISDQTIKKATFNNFKIIDDGTKQLKTQGFNIANDILNGSDNTYVFAGPTGRGKSHIAMAIANRVNIESYKQSQKDFDTKPFKCIYMSVPRMISAIHESYNMSYEDKINYPYTEERVVGMIASSDLAVLDDIGAEVGRLNGKTVASNSVIKILTQIFETRQGKATIVTTNLTKQQTEEIYDDRVSSRINSNVAGLEFSKTTDKRMGGIS